MSVGNLSFKHISYLVLLFTLFSAFYLATPTATHAQKKPPQFQSAPQDEEQLCAAGGALAGSRYCFHYINYRNNEINNNDAARFARDRLIEYAQGQVDTYFYEHKTKKKRSRALLQTIFDVLEIGAAVAISITNGERAKTVIAEALTGFQAGRTSLNKNFELLQTKVLISKMRANRAKILTKIVENQAKSVKDYSWQRAKNDLRDYFYAGTFSEALDALATETGAEAVDAEVNLAEAKRNAGIVGALTPQQIEDLNSNFKKVEALLQAYEDAKSTTTPNIPTARQLEILQTYKRIYNQIQANDQLKNVSDKLPDRYTEPADQSTKTRLTRILNDLRSETVLPAKDYEFYLLQISGAVKGTPLNKVFADILNVNKP